MNLPPEAFQSLSPYEVGSFLRLRGVTRNISFQEFLTIVRTDGGWTTPLIDLYLAWNTPTGTEMYSRKQILSLPSETLRLFSQALYLELNDPQLVDRIIRILRFKKLLIDDVQFSFPQGLILSEVTCARLREMKIPYSLTNFECTPLSRKIATSLIRIAATRVFADPTQGILELPVNSIDAYHVLNGQKERVGKFGLGFFSILYWVVMNPQRTLLIDSTYLDPNGKLIRWEGQFNQTDQGLVIYLRYSSPGPSTGTTILLHSLTNLPVKKFQSQLNKLVNVTSVNIYLISGKNSKVLNTPGENKSTILITLEPNQAKVVDWATGISLETLFGSLLIPSISTKQIQTVQVKPSINPLTRFTPNSQEEFNILVGEIIVFKTAYSSPVSGLAVSIQMNIQTPLPISRDDILLSVDWVKEEFILNVKHLLREALQNPTLYPLALFRALKTYQSPYLGNTLIEDLQKSLQDEWILVPYKDISLYQVVTSQNLVGIDGSLHFQTEDRLLQISGWETNVFYGKYVRWIPTTLGVKASPGGSSRLLFLSEEYRTQRDTWKADLAVALGELYLLPYQYTSSQRQNQLFKDAIRNIREPELQDIMFNLLLQQEGLRTYYDVNDNVKQLTWSLLEVYRISPNLFRDISAIYTGYMLRLRPPEAYGEQKPRLLTSYRRQTIKVPSKDLPKFEAFIREILTEIITPAIRLNDLMLFPLLEPAFNFAGSDQILFDLAETGLEYSFLKLLKIELTGNEAKALLEYWRYFLRNPTRESIIWNRIVSHYGRDFEASIGIISRLYITMYRSTQNFVRTLPLIPELVQPSEKAYRFSLTGLLRYVFQNPIDPDRFLSYLPLIPNYETGTDLQVLEIAINEGTTKPPIQAAVTETYQNSLDAIRMAGTGNISIKINRSENMVRYRIYDPVGISETGLLSLSIPFLSTKTPSELITGEMGSGFFNVYRRAVRVVIQTGRVFFIDTPLEKNGRIVDINREAFLFDEPKIEGTLIDIYWNFEHLAEDLTELTSYLRTVIPLSGPYTLNDQVISIQKELLLQLGPFTMYVTNEAMPSYILTKDVPFNELVPYFQHLLPVYIQESLLTGLIMNISHGGYTPVQSRTKISLSNEKEVVSFLQMVSYLQILRRQYDNPKEDILFGYNSKASAIQVLPYKSNVIWDRATFVQNFAFPGNVSLTEAIIALADLTNANPITTKPEEVQAYFNKYLPLPFLQMIIREWFMSKSYQEANNEEKARKGKPADPRLVKFSQAYLQVYWESLVALGITSSPVPGLTWEDINPSITGYYDPRNHSIILNTYYQVPLPLKLNPDSLLEFLRNAGQELFGYQIPASVMVHELTHAWIGTEHRGAHTDIILGGEKLTFDQASNTIFKKVLERNFIERVLALL